MPLLIKDGLMLPYFVLPIIYFTLNIPFIWSTIKNSGIFFCFVSFFFLSLSKFSCFFIILIFFFAFFDSDFRIFHHWDDCVEHFCLDCSSTFTFSSRSCPTELSLFILTFLWLSPLLFLSTIFFTLLH